MATFDRRSNRFLRPKRDHITPLDQCRTRLRSLAIAEIVLRQAYDTPKTFVRRRHRSGVSR